MKDENIENVKSKTKMSKKHIIFYFLIFGAIIIGMLLIKSFDTCILVYEYSDTISDGFSYYIYLSLINCCILITLLILTFYLTFTKNNKSKCKWILFIFILLILFFVFPIGKYDMSGGIAGVYIDNINMALLSFINLVL